MDHNPWADESDNGEHDVGQPAVEGDVEVEWSIDEGDADDVQREHPRHALLRHCHQVLDQLWPLDGPPSADDWRSGFADLTDIAALLAQLLPTDPALPPPLPFASTATAKAMNDALKLTRHLPASASSPLSRLLASKGALEWEKSIRANQPVVPDPSHVGWRVLEKDDRVDEAKQRKPVGGFLSFWNRRTSAPVEERATSPARSSLENAKSPPPSRDESPSRAVPPPPTVATAPAPSAVSRFLNRFARPKGTQHSVLALSSDDLEFLSDIVPSASDPPDDPLIGADNSSPMLPPLIPPPPKSSSSDAASMNGGAPDVPVLAPPPSPKPPASLSRSQSPVLQGRSSTLKLSVPPLLPPPPSISPPQTPRPNAFPSITMQSTVPFASHDFHDSDDEFSAFKSFPSSSPAPFSLSDPYPLQRSPTPPSPPPRRTYERTHYPSSSSTSSSILSPASQTSADQIFSTRSTVSASLDSFDDFVSPPRDSRRTPSPPPLPAKLQSPQRQPSRINTAYHAHTPSLTTVSPTMHTSLLNSSPPSVSIAEHQRTQSLVNHAAARGGLLWPDSPPMSGTTVKAIPPPPSSSALLFGTGDADVDLLGHGDVLGEVSSLGRVGKTSTVSSMHFGVGSDKGFGSRAQLQPSPPPPPSTPAPLLSFASLGALVPSPPTQSGSLQPVKPKQTGGLSAQDLSFFEGL